MSTQLLKIAAKAKQDPKTRFTSLAHILTPEFLRETWRQLNRKGASGIDGETIEEFETNLEERIHDLWRRLRAGQYQAPPVRRVEIPKGNGKTRPLGIPTVEDRLLQRAVARILSAIYEPEFLECSFGYRPGRNPHLALKALRDHIVTGKVRHVYEADIEGYFTNLNHEWLRRMISLRIADPVITRLIGKWLKAGVMEHGVVARPDAGTPQGGPISPCLANAYGRLFGRKGTVPLMAL
jgi:group II intron reverse transcriptase/maturase